MNLKSGWLRRGIYTLCALLIGLAGTGQARADSHAYIRNDRLQGVPAATVVVSSTSVVFGPGGGFSAIAILVKDEVVPVTGISVDHQFWQVNTRFGMGFVPASDVTVSNSGGVPVVPTNPIGTVTRSIGVVRAGPSIFTRRLATLNGSDQFFILGNTPDGSWLHISIRLGIGWIATFATDQNSQIAQTSALASVTTGPRATVVTGQLNLRAGPGLQFVSRGMLPGGSTVAILGRSEDGMWLYVTTPIGQGWISSGMVITLDYSPAKTPVTAPQSQTSDQSTGRVLTGTLHLRTGPNKAFDAIGVLDANAQLTILGQSADGMWWYVNSPLGKGWVSKLYVLITGKIPNVPVVNP